MARVGLGSRLDPKSKIYYSYLSSTKHAGRVGDLINAHFRMGGSAALKVRFFIDCATSIAFSGKAPTILIESAQEGTSVYFSMQFHSEWLKELGFERIVKRWTEGAADSNDSQLFLMLSTITEELKLQWDEVSATAEFYAVISMQSGIKASPTAPRVDKADVGDEPPAQEAKQYIELGDLDYDKMLDRDVGKSSIRPPLTGQFVAGGLANEEVRQIIKGSAQTEQNNEKIVVSGGSEPTVDNEAITVDGAAAEKEMDEALNVEKIEKLTSSIYEQTQMIIESSKGVEPQVKAMASNMLKELMEEKSKLVEKTRDINQYLKQKDLEFRTRERGLQEELRRKDETLRQRSAAVNHLKEQFSKLMGTVEKLKANASGKASEDGYKERFEELQTRMEPMQKEREELSLKADKLLKQLDEFKRVNRQLMDRIAKLEKKRTNPGGPQGEEMRKKMSQLMQVAEQRRLESEMLRRQLEITKRELAEATNADADSQKDGQNGKKAA